MYQPRPWISEADDHEEADRQTASLAGVAVILVLLVAGLFLVQALRTESTAEDCLLSGRTNCDVLAIGPP